MVDKQPHIRPNTRIALSPGTKALRIERTKQKIVHGSYKEEGVTYMTTEFGGHGSWCVWIHAAPDFNSGTFLRLYDDGRMCKVYLHPDGWEEEMELKPSDSQTKDDPT